MRVGKYRSMIPHVIQILRNGATVSELRWELWKMGYKTKYMSFYQNIIRPAYKLGLIVRKGDKYYTVRDLETCTAWKNPKFFADPLIYGKKLKKYVSEHKCPKEVAFIQLYPDKTIEVVKGLIEIIKKGGRPDPKLNSMKILMIVKKHNFLRVS